MSKVTPQEIQEAARLIRRGRLVAFPTETVYGLGANALDEAAVARIFTAKGRPSTSPLIVHVATIEAARELVTNWPDSAERLARRYWPGPLTLVLPKGPRVPDIVTAGLKTVGVRIPNHPVALDLIRQAGVPIAAPSANLFTELSPTRARHVRSKLIERVDCLLDGGATPVGIESTVISLSGESPVLLRPGTIPRDDLESLIGPLSEPVVGDTSHPSPGLHKKHYSPATALVLVTAGALPAKGQGAYLWLTKPTDVELPVQMPADACEYAACLYGILHDLDRKGLDWIAVEEPPAGSEWDGVRDRLGRAAH